VDASISRAEAGLGRFVLDEEVKTSGNIYYSQWRLAGQQIRQLERLVRSDPEQRKRVLELMQLYQVRGQEFALAARATVAKQGSGGTGYFYQAAGSDTGTDLSAKLAEIARAERALLRQRMEQTKFFSAEADRLTDYLSWLGVIVGLGAIFLGLVAIQAIRQFAYAKKLAETETERAEGLEEAVAERTRELREANLALKAEAGALADGLGREERLEGALHHLRRHSATGVGDADADIFAGPDVAHLIGREGYVGRAHAHQAFAFHRVARVHREVDDRILELVRVDVDRPHVRREVDLDMDALAERAVEQV
jgi:CHASE3 domain sensor protein